MVKVVNLRTIRKQKARSEARVQSHAKTRSSGISKAEHSLATHINDLADRKLSGHQREDED